MEQTLIYLIILLLLPYVVSGVLFLVLNYKIKVIEKLPSNKDFLKQIKQKKSKSKEK